MTPERKGDREHEHGPEGADRPIKTARELVEERLRARAPALAADALRQAADRAPAEGEAAPPSGPRVPVDAAELEALRAKAAERDGLLDQLLRARADLDNYQKRIQREMASFRDFAAQQLITDILPAVDSLDLTVKAAEGTRDVDALLAGVRMAGAEVMRVLGDRGVRAIDARPGTPFDPNLHEAVAVEERADRPANEITDEVRRGYQIKDRVIRASQVRVSRTKAATERPADGPGAAGERG